MIAPLAACSSADSADAKDTAVPAGVQQQYEVLAAEVSERGGKTTSGEWTVSYIVEAAEPWFERNDDTEDVFREPRSGETHHIEIIPTETDSGRIVPDVPITLEVVAADGEVVQEKKLNFYYSTFFHYANNFSIPEDGPYTLRATLGAPTFFRHGEEADGPALAEGTTVEFGEVELSQE
jgi:hypothetical protein